MAQSSFKEILKKKKTVSGGGGGGPEVQNGIAVLRCMAGTNKIPQTGHLR